MPALFHPAARYTRFVLLSKRVLWLLAILLTLALIATVWFNTSDENARLVFTGDEGKTKSAPEPAAMVKPRYQGIDSKNQPFTILAERAVQLSKSQVQLNTLNADLTRADGSWLALTSGEGLYDSDSESLDLTRGVSLFFEGGYEFRTEAAHIDVQAGEAEGNNPVEGQGPAGVLKANRFKILDRGNVLRFNDEVKVTLYL